MAQNRTRPILINFRVTEHESEIIDRKKSLTKIKSREQFIRKMVLEGMILNVDYSQIRGICNELGTIGSNINQIARRVNSTSNIYGEDIAEIKKKQTEIFKLLNSMEEKLL